MTPGRFDRLRNLRDVPHGHIWMGKCACGDLAALPVASLIKKYGELFAISTAMDRIACSGCGVSGKAELRLMRLCEPGCGRHRG